MTQKDLENFVRWNQSRLTRIRILRRRARREANKSDEALCTAAMARHHADKAKWLTSRQRRAIRAAEEAAKAQLVKPEFV